MFSLESTHQGDSNEYTHTYHFQYNYPVPATVGFFQGIQEQVQNSRGRRAISVRATEVLLYSLVRVIFLTEVVVIFSSFITERENW